MGYKKIKIKKSILKTSYCMQDFYNSINFNNKESYKIDASKLIINKDFSEDLSKCIKNNFYKKCIKEHLENINNFILEWAKCTGEKLNLDDAIKLTGMDDYNIITRSEKNFIAMDLMMYMPCTSDEVEYGYILYDSDLFK